MSEVMDELQLRFLMNLPASELASSERLFFQIEQCYWFYEDFYADNHKHLKNMSLNEFTKIMFQHSTLLQPLQNKYSNMLKEFKTFKSEIPVIGCIMLNERKNKVLLVRNWKGTAWTFPRGKINQGETDMECAVREALEECGYDATGKVMPENYIQFNKSTQRVRLYVVAGVPEDYNFAPQTRKEISLIQFFPLDELPKKTYMVLPFMARLKRYIAGRGPSKSNKSQQKVPKESRSLSVPKHRPNQVASVPPPDIISTSSLTKNYDGAKTNHRSVSTPHERPRVKRGHFGTEAQTGTSRDVLNHETFGHGASARFSVDEMFSVNEKLTGQTFEYDGNPHGFGNYSSKPQTPPRLIQTDHDTSHLAAPVAALFKSVHQHTKNGAIPPKLVPHALPLMIPNKANATRAESGRSSSTSSSKTDEEDNDDVDSQPDLSRFEFDTMDIMACVT